MRGRLPFSALIELRGDKGHLQRERSYVHRNGSVSASFRLPVLVYIYSAKSGTPQNIPGSP